MTTINDINNDYRTEQILALFGLKSDGNGKILCPKHAETQASCYINEKYAFCFGCKSSFDNFHLLETLLEKQLGYELTAREVVRWFDKADIPEPSTISYEQHVYRGPVPPEFIAYWADCMTDTSYEVLRKERLLTKETCQLYHLGWRADMAAWTIPFYRGTLGQSDVDIVQFRRTTGDEPKYIGLRGHNRGAVMNAYLLEIEQPYLVVFFGSFDAILAAQDGLLAVGLNGCFPFKKDEKLRVKALFEKQSNILVVPDNTPAEFSSAYKLVEWVGGQVKFFDKDLPVGCDYIDYRKLGHFVDEFKQDVLELDFPAPIVDNIKSLWQVGDPFNFARWHATLGTQECYTKRLITELVKMGPLHYSAQQWAEICSTFKSAQSRDELFDGLTKASQLAFNYTGSW
jgi:hypothetical protein